MNWGITRNLNAGISFTIWASILLLILSTKLFSPEAYTKYFEREDAFSEYLQALNYFLAAIVSFYVFVLAKRNGLSILSALYLFLGLGLLFVSLEEISWGQRIFGISNPEYFNENNVQEELTIHNLKAFQPLLRHAYIAISAYGTFAWIFSRLLRSISHGDCRSFVNYVVVECYLAPYFLICFLIYTWLHYVRPYMYLNNIGKFSDEFWFFLHWRDEEHAELFLSFGFILFVIVKLQKLKNCLDRDL
jgi:hypothetical protein